MHSRSQTGRISRRRPSLTTGDVEAALGDIEEFIPGHRESSSSDSERVLATVLFTDIVDSTRSAATMGDRAWRKLLDRWRCKWSKSIVGL
jgi:class 3 adenylate cyclase